jgi:serine/threonine-protein kinase RsbW
MVKKNNTLSMAFRSNLKFTELCVLALNFLKNMLAIDDENYFKIEISLREAVNNAIVHGNENNIDKLVKIDFWWEKGLLRIYVRDECSKKLSVEEIESKSRAADILAYRGRGILIMKSYMDRFEFIPEKSGNLVVLEKQLQ